MKKIAYIIVILLLAVSCSDEFQPSSFVPDIDGGIEEVFPDSISGFKSNTRFDFMNDSCKAISATYGDNDDIYIQILLVDKYYASIQECISDYIMPYFGDFDKIKKDYNNFSVTASDDIFSAFTWSNDEFIFFLRCKEQYLDAIVNETSYIKYK